MQKACWMVLVVALVLAAQAQPLVPAERRDFFQAHVLTELNVHLHWNQMLLDLAGAASPWVSPSTRLAGVRAAIQEIHGLMETVQKADYDKWQGFHTRGDWFDNVALTLALAQACETKLAGKTFSPAQQEVLKTAEHYLNADTSNVYIKIKAYQEGRKVQFCAPAAKN